MGSLQLPIGYKFEVVLDGLSGQCTSPMTPATILAIAKGLERRVESWPMKSKFGLIVYGATAGVT